MKTFRNSAICLFFVTVLAVFSFAQSNIDVSILGNSTSASSILIDNFAGTSVDPAKWSIDLPYGDSAVIVNGATCTSYNRGYLVSTDIDASSIEINVMVKLTGDRTSANLVWKTDGTHTAGSNSPTNGIVLGIYNESQSVVIGLTNGQYKQVFMPIPLDTWRQFRIVDTDNVVSLYIDGSSTATIEFPYDSEVVGTNKKMTFFSRESAYCGSVGASITAFSVADLSPAPTELLVEVTQPAMLSAIVTPEDPVADVATAEALPAVTVTNAETNEVVATDIVLTGDTTIDTTKKLDCGRKNHHRKAYGIIIAQHNRTKNLHCAVTEKLPAGIYVFTFQCKPGAKNVKFNANVVQIADDDAKSKCSDKKNESPMCGGKGK